jgi:hypothetical protein
MDTPDLAAWEADAVRDDQGGARPLYGHIQVWGIDDDGSRHALFAYYSDELTFPPDELQSLIGATPEEARRLASDLLLRRDLAYLRSQ